MRRVLCYGLIFLFFLPGMAFAQYHQWTRLKGGHFYAESKEAYDKAWSLIDARDEEALNKMFWIGAISRTVEGTEVYVQDVHVFHDSAEIRFRGDTHIYWVLSTALYPADAQIQIEQAIKSKSINKNDCKLDGVMTENGRPLIFISHRGKINPAKVGDHICDDNGQIIKGYAPGEKDGISDHNVDKYEYRIKVRFKDREEIFRIGDVLYGSL